MNRRLYVLFLLLLLMVVVPTTAAQGVAVLTYGSSAAGTLSSEAPLNLYTFSGNTGDLVTARVFGLEPGMTPNASLLGPNQQVLAGSPLEQLTSGNSVVLNRILPSAGVYTLLVGGSPGGYLVSLSGSAVTATTPLALPANTPVTLGADGSSQVFSVGNASQTAVAIAVANSAVQGAFSLAVYNAAGQSLAHFDGAVSDVCVSIPGGSGTLTVALAGANGGQPLGVTLSVVDGSCTGLTVTQSSPPQPVQPAQPTQVPPPATTPEVSSPQAACTASSGGAVNVRSGPGTEYGILTSLQAGVQAAVVGQSGNGWIVIQINGVQGFVSQTVVGVFGSCAGLPFIAAPNQPPAAATATPPQQQAPTATLQQQQQQPPTATATQANGQGVPPTATTQQQQPPPTATASYTPTATLAAIVAPPDSNYAMQVPLDQTVSVTDFVSFPDGDTEDVVSYGVTGLNNSVALPGGQAALTLSFSCFGTGTQFISFIVDGQTRSCGQSYNRTVNADSNTGAVRVRATGGEATYVQWVVTGSAPRTN
jgi:uncharacterized protein YraI